jgi:hypothetical protein
MPGLLRNLLLLAAVLLATYAPALAQNVTVIGPITPGHCTSFFSTTQIQDSGIGCGGGSMVSSITNSDGTLAFSPTTGAVVGSLALGHSNTWTAAQAFAGLTATSITDSGITGLTQCVQANSAGVLSGTGSACGSGGGGAVSSVTNSDGTLTISPTTGAVVASLALGHANIWSANQTFSATVIYSGVASGTQVACLGIDASNNVVRNAAACGAGGGGGTPSPTSQKFLTGSGTYTTPVGVQWIVIQLQGAGGGGAGGGSAISGTGGTGGNTCWNTSGAACTSPVYQAGGGVGAVSDATLGGAGGTVSGSGTCLKATPGATGTAGAFATGDETGGVGGASANGGGGGGASGGVGADGAINSGGGGGGAGSPANGFPGGGGGGGANCIALISSPAATYTYAVAAGGTGGTAGTSGFAGGNGSAGGVWVTEYYTPGGGGNPGGSSTQLQYNNAGALGGITGATSNGTVVTFANSDIKLLGSSTGATTFTSANAGASNFTATIPANTGTLAELNLAQTFSAQQTFSSTLAFSGTGTGTQVSCLGLDASNNVIHSAAACGAGGGGTPGGSNTDVQFNNSSAFGGDAGFTYLGNGQATLALGTITTNLKALTITGTFNAVGTTFDAPLFMSITNTASASGSMLADFQVGGVTKLSFAISSGAPLLVLGAPTSAHPGLDDGGGGILRAVLGDESALASFSANNLTANGTVTVNGGTLYLNSASDARVQFGTSADPTLVRQSSNILSIQNGVNATALRVYNTSDSETAPTNYERAAFDWTVTANVLTIGSQAGGTGTGRPVLLVSAGLYSAAGVALPTCNAGSKGAQAVVSDATAPTYNAIYTSGGAIVAHVVCDGTNWKTQ